MIRRITLLLLFLSLIISHSWAEQEFFPFLAETTSDRVNIRAGQSKNFEKLGQLSQGQDVVVIGRNYSWYKVRLPKEAKSFVNAQYVQLIDTKNGKVVGKRVNVRAGAGIYYSVLGQLQKGDQVVVLGQVDDWYRIEPMEESFGWVLDSLVTFKSNDIKSYVSTSLVSEKKEEIIKEVAVEKVIEPEEILEPEEPAQITVAGYLKVPEDDGIYKLFVSDQLTYHLEGPSYIFSEFGHYKVSVEGSVKKKESGHRQNPVIIISKIELIL